VSAVQLQVEASAWNTTTLGRTGLRVSVAGLGCGGFSQLGLGTGKKRGRRDPYHPRGARPRGQFVRHRGGLRQPRRCSPGAARGAARPGRHLHQGAVRGQQPEFDARERRRQPRPLAEGGSGTDTIDVYQLHGIAPRAYDHAVEVLAPALLRERDKGKFRHLGITETAPNDPLHEMVPRACRDGVWDVVDVAPFT